MKKLKAEAHDSVILLGDISCLFNNPIIAAPICNRKCLCTLEFVKKSNKLKINGLEGLEADVVKTALLNLKIEGTFNFIFDYQYEAINDSVRAAAALLCVKKLISELGLEPREKISLIPRQIFSTTDQLPFATLLASSFLGKPIAARVREGFIELALIKPFKMLYLPLTLRKPKIDNKLYELEDILSPLTHTLGHLSIEAVKAIENGDTSLLFYVMELESRLTLSLLDDPYEIFHEMYRACQIVNSAIRYSFYHHAIVIPYLRYRKSFNDLTKSFIKSLKLDVMTP